MANLLVFFSETDGNPEYNKWDVVSVRPDDYPWGTAEGYPLFLKVHLKNVTHQEAGFLLDVQLDMSSTKIDKDTGLPTEKLYRRGWGFKENRIPTPIRNQINDAYLASEVFVVEDGQAVIDWVEKKIDQSTKTGWGRD